MKNISGEKYISTSLLIVFFICVIYASHSKNQNALILAALIFAFYKILETIWTLKAREYKTTYWIVLSNIVNILCNLLLVALLIRDKNISSIEAILNHISKVDALIIVFTVSTFVSPFLSLDTFKMNKASEADEVRDM